MRGAIAGLRLATILIASFHATVVSGSDLPDGQSCGPAPDPSRIVVAGGSITEILFSLGEQRKIVAVDRTSNYPADVSEFPIIGYVRTLSAEGVLSLAPSLVLGEDDMGPIEVLNQLKSTGISIRRIPERHTALGIVEKVLCVAEVMGYPESELDRLKQEYRAKVKDVARARGEVKRGDRPKVAVIMALRDGVPFAAGSETSAAGILEMAGGDNVFAGFKGWKPVSLELMVGANPSLIVMPERGMKMSGGREAVLSHPSIKVTNAAKNNGLVAVDGMTLLGFGPRTLQASIDLSKEFERLNDVRR